MKLRSIIDALERYAPLRYQDGFDNSGLQVGMPDADISKVLICLDVTEAVVEEAAAAGCQLIVSHHPLLFRPLKQISDATYQQRCAVKAICSGIAIYSAHTSLDNAPGGVNHMIAGKLSLRNLSFLSPKDDGSCGSGLIGELSGAVDAADFFRVLKETFGVECLLHSAADGRVIRKVAVCGGAGAFLMPEAIAAGADCFVCGEFHYHDYFENGPVLLAELGHYQSEQFTIDLLSNILSGECPELQLLRTSINTNPIKYDK